LPLLEPANAFWREFDPDNVRGADAASWLGRCAQQLGRAAVARNAQDRASRLRAAAERPASQAR
jgi:hypothetical protein